MTELKRLLKRRFVKPFLLHAQQAMGPGVGIAVVSGEQTIAAVGDIAVDGTDNVLRAPLKIDGREAGHLLVGPVHAAGPTDTADVRAQLLCRSLQAVSDAEAERRAVTTEALETYRELSLLHRAAVELNRSLEEVEVAAADFLAELGSIDSASEVFRAFAQELIKDYTLKNFMTKFIQRFGSDRILSEIKKIKNPETRKTVEQVVTGIPKGS